jgi:hypothetical protein
VTSRRPTGFERFRSLRSLHLPNPQTVKALIRPGVEHNSIGTLEHYSTGKLVHFSVGVNTAVRKCNCSPRSLRSYNCFHYTRRLQ